jgi:hypothetical protein
MVRACHGGLTSGMGQGSGVVGVFAVPVGWGPPVVVGCAWVVGVSVVTVGALVGSSVGALLGMGVAVAVVVEVGVADGRGGVVVVFRGGRFVGLAGFVTAGVTVAGTASGGRTSEWVSAVSMNSAMRTQVERRGPAAAWEILAHPIRVLTALRSLRCLRCLRCLRWSRRP